MPARPRLASDLFDKALEVQRRYPGDEGVKELIIMAAENHYGSELALAFLNRGVNGDQARRLLREYDRFKQRMNAEAPAG